MTELYHKILFKMIQTYRLKRFAHASSDDFPFQGEQPVEEWTQSLYGNSARASHPTSQIDNLFELKSKISSSDISILNGPCTNHSLRSQRVSKLVAFINILVFLQEKETAYATFTKSSPRA